MDHDANVVGAAVVALADRVLAAAEEAAGRAGSQAAALTSLHGWADGTSVEALAGGLALSHSRTVRIVDALERDGLVQRGSDPEDGRRVTVRLTATGRRAATAILAARAEVLADALGELDRTERARLASISEKLLVSAASTRNRARVICRFCDLDACGHLDGRCPSTRGADRDH